MRFRVLYQNKPREMFGRADDIEAKTASEAGKLVRDRAPCWLEQDGFVWRVWPSGDITHGCPISEESLLIVDGSGTTVHAPSVTP